MPQPIKSYHPRYHFNNVLHGERVMCAGFRIIQFGEMICNADSVIREHKQSCYELTFVQNGRGRVLADDTTLSVRAGDCILSFPNELHRIESDADEPLSYAFLAFEENADNACFSYLFKELSAFAVRPVRDLVNLPVLGERIVRFFTEMKSEQRRKISA